MKDLRPPRLNPLDIHFWLLGVDAREGDLEARGYRKSSHPQGLGSSVYRRGRLGLHSMGLWLDGPSGRLLYLRANDRFFLVSVDTLPPGGDPPGRPLAFAEGMRLLEPHLRLHERWIARRRGNDYRRQLLDGLPARHRKGSQAWLESMAPRVP